VCAPQKCIQTTFSNGWLVGAVIVLIVAAASTAAAAVSCAVRDDKVDCGECNFVMLW
jgi:hypothetical protein